ncbi:hypothetical protein OAQ84_01360 [Bdellovibrionales bacterium]|nr:hypothetical protein [Bdellovibrionales bacterium]
MFFSRKPLSLLGVTLLIGSLATTILGCGLSLGDKTPKTKAVVVSPDRYNCLSEIGIHISNYFSDKMTAKEIKTVVGCMKQAVIQFERYTHGKNRNSYTREEFTRFIKKYFVKDRPIPPELVSELMTLKVSLTGGDEKVVTREELLRISDFIGLLGETLFDLKPYLSIYNLKAKMDHSGEKNKTELKGATDALLRNAIRFGNWGERSRRSYSLFSFERLVHQVREFSQWNKIHKKSFTAAQWINLLRAFKSSMVRPPERTLMSKDWIPLMRSLAKWYTVWLNYKYQVSNRSIFYGEGFKALVSSSELMIELLRSSLTLQPTKEISYEQITKLVNAAGDLKLWPSKIRRGSILKTVEMVFDKIFGDRFSPGLTRLALTRAETELYGWVAVQKHLDDGYSEVLRRRPFQSSDYGGDRPDPPIHVDLEGQMKPFPKTAIHFIEMDHIIRFTRPIYQSNNRVAMIVYPSQRQDLGLAHGIHSLSRFNVLRVLTRLLFSGYSTESNFMEGVSAEGLQSFYLDARDLGIDLGIFDPRSKDVGCRAFMEGNLFTAYSDGQNMTVKEVLPIIPPEELFRIEKMGAPYSSKETNPFNRISKVYEKPNPRLLSFKETLDLMAIVHSGGIIRDRIYSFLLKKCKAEKGKGKDKSPINDEFGNAMLRKSCVREKFLDGVTYYFAGMPKMVSYLQKRTDDAKFDIIDLILKTASRKGQDKDLIELSELAVVAMIVQYSESLMVRFDHNEDQIVSNEEVWKYAYPVFRGFIHKVALEDFGRDLTDEGDIRSTLAFIIEEGRLPSSDLELVGIWIDSLFHFDNSTDWGFSVDRGDLLRVFSTVIGAANSGRKKNSAVKKVKDPKGKCQSIEGV